MSKLSIKINIIAVLLAIGFVLGFNIQSVNAQTLAQSILQPADRIDRNGEIIKENSLHTNFEPPQLNYGPSTLTTASIKLYPNGSVLPSQPTPENNVVNGIEITAPCCGKEYYEQMIIADPNSKDLYLHKIKVIENGPFSITEIKEKMVGDNKLIFGKITNNQYTTAYGVTILADLLDKDNNSIGKVTSYPTPSDLNSDETGSFRITISPYDVFDISQLDHYKITAVKAY